MSSTQSVAQPNPSGADQAALEAAQAFWMDQWRASDNRSQVSIPWRKVPALVKAVETCTTGPALDLPDGLIDGILEAKATLVEAVRKLRAAVPEDAGTLELAGWPGASDIVLNVHTAAEGIEWALDNLSVTPDIRSLYEDTASGTRDGFDGVRKLLDDAAAVEQRVAAQAATTPAK